MDAWDNISIDANPEYLESGFSPENFDISHHSLGNYVENKYGPLGIFYDESNKTYIGHDMGNLYTLSKEATEKLLGLQT